VNVSGTGSVIGFHPDTWTQRAADTPREPVHERLRSGSGHVLTGWARGTWANRHDGTPITVPRWSAHTVHEDPSSYGAANANASARAAVNSLRSWLSRSPPMRHRTFRVLCLLVVFFSRLVSAQTYPLSEVEVRLVYTPHGGCLGR
jgi:hypothetical protein